MVFRAPTRAQIRACAREVVGEPKHARARSAVFRNSNLTFPYPCLTIVGGAGWLTVLCAQPFIPRHISVRLDG